ncbi:MAG: hypothetical protein EOO16_14075 [Chitinophagaceae bacterium]|nr:MAG: hypothetical protein EOO16_14075 [Chitinophagaceae bacterium]
MKHFLFLSVGSFFLLASCRRDNIPEDRITGNSRMSAYTIYDSSNAGTALIRRKGTVEYDAHGRPTLHTIYDPSQSGALAIGLRVRYYYALPVDSVAERTESENSSGILHTRYEWNGSLLLRDTGFLTNSAFAGPRANTYTYQGNEAYRYTAGYTDMGTVNRETVHYVQSWQGDDLMQHTDTLVRDLGNGTGYQRTSITATYLPEANPFFVLVRPVFRKVATILDPSALNWEFAQRHLVSSRSYTIGVWGAWQGGTDTYDFSYSYLFDAQGRVTRMIEEAPSLAHRYVIVFEYQ